MQKHLTVDMLLSKLEERYSPFIQQATIACEELTVEVEPRHLRALCLALRDDPEFAFTQLIDVCGVDYLHYGVSEWETQSATATGFERGVIVAEFKDADKRKNMLNRFASVYHLLSMQFNQRIRLKVYLDPVHPIVNSVTDIWPSANWFEREAFDLFGIIYSDHPDLRRLLTDYGFIGHPFRKDFPLIGKVEARYDAVQKQVIYETVSIEPRILEPKVIRDDNRYEKEV
jgi:NADH-quinone oxidoreductase subunit C